MVGRFSLMRHLRSLPSMWDANTSEDWFVANLEDDVVETLASPILIPPMGGPVYPSVMFGVSIDTLMKGPAERYFKLKKRIKELKDEERKRNEQLGDQGS